METVKLLQTTVNDVVIGFFSKLNGENAGEAEAELLQIRQEHPQGKLVFDFAELVYISSAGLRVLLKCAKSEREKIKIINADSGVYEVLESTGFLRQFQVQKRLKQYALADLRLIGQGANGAVYRIDQEHIVKVFQKTAPLETIERERSMAQEALFAGLPTAIAYDMVQVDGCYGIVFELIDTTTLAHVLQARPEDYDFFIEEYINLYRRIHETKGDAAAFPSIKQVYYDAIAECQAYYTPAELEKLRALIAAVPEADNLIHGDYHPNNIMVRDGELLLIDMGDMSRGHILFDFLATAVTQANLVKLDAKFAEAFVKMPVALINTTWRRLIDSYFADKTAAERQRLEEQICRVAKIKAGLAPAFGRGVAQEIIQASVNDAKENLLPYIDDLIAFMDWQGSSL